MQHSPSFSPIISTALLLLFVIGAVSSIREQSVAVRGRLLCGAAPAKNVRVKLWEEDSGPDPDDLLEAGYTNSNGEFSLKGTETETTNIDPILKIYHDCDDGFKPGSRKIKFKIPSQYISSGRIAAKVFDLGTINLETIFASEERELIVSKRHAPAVVARHRRHHHHRRHAGDVGVGTESERLSFFNHF